MLRSHKTPLFMVYMLVFLICLSACVSPKQTKELNLGVTVSPSLTLTVIPTNLKTVTPVSETVTPTQILSPTQPDIFPPPTQTQNPEILNYSGFYSVEYENGAGCTVHILQEPNTNFVQYEFFCTRGAPSYNLGTGQGSFELNGMEGMSIRGEKCSHYFVFTEFNVTVEQTGSDFDCGLGSGVAFHGTFLKTSSEPPILGCLKPYLACTPTPTPEPIKDFATLDQK